MLNKIKKRVAENSPVETIETYILFNNLLSIIPMAFNIFHPLMMIKEKYPDDIAGILQSVFPDLDIHHLDDIKIELIPEPIKNYTNDKTGIDAAIFFSDEENNKYIISFEVEYTDCLGTNVVRDKENKNKIDLEFGLFRAAGLGR